MQNFVLDFFVSNFYGYGYYLYRTYTVSSFPALTLDNFRKKIQANEKTFFKSSYFQSSIFQHSVSRCSLFQHSVSICSMSQHPAGQEVVNLYCSDARQFPKKVKLTRRHSLNLHISKAPYFSIL